MDIDSIPPGVDFVELLEEAVGACDILLACIGKRWLTSVDADGQRRLDHESDFVRLEIVAALNRNIRVIPVLLQGATMPRTHDLPGDLAKLARRQALEVSSTRWRYDVGRLIAAIEQVVQAHVTTKLSPSTSMVAPTIPAPSAEQKAQAETLRKQGNTKYDQGKLEESLADFNKAIQLDPTNASTYYDRGWVYKDQGKLDQALADYNRAIELDPKFTFAYYNRGLLYERKNNKALARADFQRAADLGDEDGIGLERM